ncbi:hypothetical protein CRG98_016166, partial [Punica granatum]
MEDEQHHLIRKYSARAASSRSLTRTDIEAEGSEGEENGCSSLSPPPPPPPPRSSERAVIAPHWSREELRRRIDDDDRVRHGPSVPRRLELLLLFRLPLFLTFSQLPDKEQCGYRSLLSSDEHAGVHVSSRRISHSSCFDMPCYHRVNGGGGGSSISRRKNLARNKVRATAEHLGSASDPIKYNGRAGYHPFEDVAELASGGAGDARLTTAETVRTVVEVNSKATLLFSGVVGDEVHENILWPDLPYATDEHGNIYFQVNNDEDIMRALASDTHMVHVIIGLDTMEMMNDIEISGPAEIDFGIEEIGEEDSDFEEDGEDDDAEDDDYEEDWVSVLEDEDDLDESDGNLGDWAKLDTMHYSHPMYFAKKLAEVASDDPIDCMERPPVGIVIHGLLRPALIEEKSVIQKLLSGHNSSAD